MRLPAPAITVFASRSLSDIQRRVVIRAWSDAKCDVICALVQRDHLLARRRAETCRMLVTAFAEPVRRKCKHGVPLNDICRECDPTVCIEPISGWRAFTWPQPK